MSLVIDCSMTLSWYFEDERTAARIAVLNQVADAWAVVPALWRLEVLSGLQVALRPGRITVEYRDASIADPRVVDRDRSRDQSAGMGQVRCTCATVWGDALRCGLSRTGVWRQLPLATLDGELARAARAESVPLAGTA